MATTCLAANSFIRSFVCCNSCHPLHPPFDKIPPDKCAKSIIKLLCALAWRISKYNMPLISALGVILPVCCLFVLVIVVLFVFVVLSSASGAFELVPIALLCCVMFPASASGE